ncbi:MAG: hypothetical protein IKT65_04000 [Clostridia bacterium]|nr:hypothetical protein [Clostridia bacterium]
MKKRVLIIGSCAVAVIIIAVAIICIALGNFKGSKAFKCEEAYKTKIEEFYKVITSPESADMIYDGLGAVQQAALEFGDEAPDKFGYAFKDVNKDGKEELFIGCFDDKDSAGANNNIYAAFTHDGEMLTQLFEKQERNTFALTDTGTLYFHGSDGIAYHIVAEYEMTEEGIVCKDFYFSYPKFGDINEVEYFHNTTGEWDPDASEKVDMTFEQLEEIRKELAARTIPIDSKPFSTVEKSMMTDLNKAM